MVPTGSTGLQKKRGWESQHLPQGGEESIPHFTFETHGSAAVQTTTKETATLSKILLRGWERAPGTQGLEEPPVH